MRCGGQSHWLAWSIDAAGWLLISVLCAIVVMTPTTAWSQQNAHVTVAPSVVHLALTYTRQEGAGERKIVDQGTGFFVSPDGTILSTYRLVEGYVADHGSNLQIRVTIGGPPGQQGTDTIDGTLVDFSQSYDLLVLKIRPSADMPPPPVKLGRSRTIEPGAGLFTSGFNDADPFSLEGSLANRVGPAGVGYLWQLQMPVAPGQSGSPVYLSDGTVVGVLKGNSAAANGIGFMVPIDYADRVVPWLRIAELERKLALLQAELDQPEAVGRPSIIARLEKLESGMRDIGGFYQWSGELINKDLVITYNKLVAGDPHVKNVAYQLFPIVAFESGRSGRDTRMDSGTLDAIAGKDGKGGEITVEGLTALIVKKLEVTDEAVGVEEVEVRIVATTTEGVTLPPKVIRVDTRGVQR